ncbi:MAG: bifunctional 2-polyprenyl-6-hydroxyphenol methylase/3-demethylubiquinol 3-O-methyltransferase UbiG [Rhodospirillaceae bacterium]|nr:bifunctional 2-polyprenyl-6-hydroxyphenol methylase/3-demethylubiquinol 3-O-methyltransferase UbiG [Rhodospirillaceae bacterium]MYB12392.1 bifunctional 2-polyprenyl-6-hydroxyphenol methylase/3-demethylubiquinol 3-O-methyltransferase UbiG [Rhodospirillaceae bacterium]MYI49164.1 bifunctional 2-polyprenyl-6-hydroxyphenol methylase/3-demethylubiquinol 3-O-methyltransferase UbiG [Rhodospirillaceae bacterium]
MARTPKDRRSEAPPSGATGATVDEAEIARFAALAGEWWDPRGRFAPLHRMNPARLRPIRDAICRNFGRDPNGARPFDGLRIVDLGCGGGLVCEPMARLGADVTGIDAGSEAVEIARAHAAQSGLAIDYRHDTAEALAGAGEAFDIVLNLEVVEHVSDAGAFMAAAGALVKPGGLQIVATLNRTLRSMALGVVAAEYVLRWVPPGTHDWRRFLRPSEVAAHLRAAGLSVERAIGLTYSPLTDSWRESGDLGVNYMMVAQRAA